MTYDLTNYGRGLAYIFVNEKYETAEDDRVGAHKEYATLKRLFRDLTFKLKYYKDASNEKMKEELQKACRDPELKDRSCFVCVICSHGIEKTSEAVHSKDGIDKVTQHYIEDGQGNEMNTDDIIGILRDCKALRGKPKLFFIQACRDNKKDSTKKKLDLGVPVLVQAQSNQHQKRKHRKVTTDGATSGDKDDLTTEMGGTSDIQENTNAAELPDICMAESDTDTDDGLSDKDEFDTTDYYKARRKKIKERRQKEDHIRSQENDENNDDVVGQTGRHIAETDAKFRFPNQRRIDPTVKTPIKEPVTVVSIPCYDDMLVMFASNPGKFALRDSHTGGILISSLCHVINGYLIEDGLKNKDFLSVLTEVVNLQSRNTSSMEITSGTFIDVTTVPVIYHKLTKDLYFPIMKPVSWLHKVKKFIKNM